MVVKLAYERQSWWLHDLCKVCGVGAQSNWFDKSIKWSLSDGSKVRFWEDMWVEDDSLRDKFPKLYTISQCKDCVVSDLGEWANDEYKWNFQWRRERFMSKVVLVQQHINICPMEKGL